MPRTLLAFATIALGVLRCAAAPASELRILQASPFQLSIATPSHSSNQKPSASTMVSVAGRELELTLTSNDRLLRALSPTEVSALGPHELYRGQLGGIPNSWVRISRINGRTYGAMWDGVELYAIGPRAEIEAKMPRPISGASSDAAIFRWTDTEGGDAQVCGVAQDVASIADAYRSLVRELKTQAATTGLQQIEVAVIGDYEFYALFGAQSVATMLERMNVVDGIFSNQVGVSIVPTDFKVFDTTNDPFTATDASKLLEELGSYRSATPAIRSRGLAHLMTGRNLDSNTVGIAVMGALCQSKAGISLSQASNGSFTAPLIAAHELGHNFGAPHDGEGACASAPTGFLMAPSINGSSQFSSCSLQQMKAVVDSAQCVTAYLSPDVGVSFPSAPYQASVNQAFDVPIDISSAGDGGVANVKVTATLAGSIASATLNGASCAIDAAIVTCQISQLTAHETRRLTVRTTFAEQKTFNLSAVVSAWKDDNAQNNSASTTVQVGTTASAPPEPVTAPVPAASNPPPAPKKKSGGGGFELLTLLGLLGLRRVRSTVTSR